MSQKNKERKLEKGRRGLSLCSLDPGTGAAAYPERAFSAPDQACELAAPTSQPWQQDKRLPASSFWVSTQHSQPISSLNQLETRRSLPPPLRPPWALSRVRGQHLTTHTTSASSICLSIVWSRLSIKMCSVWWGASHRLVDTLLLHTGPANHYGIPFCIP